MIDQNVSMRHRGRSSGPYANGSVGFAEEAGTFACWWRHEASRLRSKSTSVKNRLVSPLQILGQYGGTVVLQGVHCCGDADLASMTPRLVQQQGGHRCVFLFRVCRAQKVFEEARCKL